MILDRLLQLDHEDQEIHQLDLEDQNLLESLGLHIKNLKKLYQLATEDQKNQ